MRIRPLNTCTSESMMVPLSAFERTKEMEIVGYTVKCDTVSHFESQQHQKSGLTKFWDSTWISLGLSGMKI